MLASLLSSNNIFSWRFSFLFHLEEAEKREKKQERRDKCDAENRNAIHFRNMFKSCKNK